MKFTNPLKQKALPGFSLLEMAIVITILSILISGLYALIPVQTEQQNTDVTNSNLQKIQSAIDAYVNLNGHLPCPASLTDPISTSTFGVSTGCSLSPPAGTIDLGSGADSIRKGALPTRSLNLPDSLMFDGWNHRFAYAVVKNLATTNTAFSTATPTSAAMVIQDANANQINNLPIAYVIVSYGKNGNGATNNMGITKNCAMGSTESKNCDSISNTFVDAFCNATGSSYYDDIIKWKTVSLQIRDSSYQGGSTFGGTSFSKFAIVADQKNSGSSSQSISPGWNTRDLNSIVTQSTPSPISSINPAAGTITLNAGTYYIKATAQAQGIGSGKLRIVDVNAGTNLAIGMSTVSDTLGSPTNSTTSNNSTVSGYFTFSSAATIRVDQFVTNAAGNFGYPTSDGSYETYTTVEILGK